MPFRRTHPPIVAALLAAAALAPAAALLTVSDLGRAGLAGGAARAGRPAVAGRPLRRDRAPGQRRRPSGADGSSRPRTGSPLSAAELRGHTSARWRAQTGSLAQRPALLRALAAARGLRLVGLNVVEPGALVASVRDRGGRRLVLTMFADRAGRDRQRRARGGCPRCRARPAARPSAAIASSSRGPAVRSRSRAPTRPPATRSTGRSRAYASPALAAALAPLYADDPGARAAALALPVVGVHARAAAPARPGRLPVVLLSPGGGASTVLYQALAEDLASHGYLVVAVDDPGDAPVELADGQIVPVAPASSGNHRVADLRFVLRRLNTIGYGPHADRRRVAVDRPLDRRLDGRGAHAPGAVDPSRRRHGRPHRGAGVAPRRGPGVHGHVRRAGRARAA